MDPPGSRYVNTFQINAAKQVARYANFLMSDYSLATEHQIWKFLFLPPFAPVHARPPCQPLFAPINRSPRPPPFALLARAEIYIDIFNDL